MKIPSDTILQYIRNNLRYNPDTGVISKQDTPTGNLRKKDNRIVINIRYGKLDDGTQLTYTTYAHQVAWYLTHGVWPSGWLDHVDGDGSNNQLTNLRYATTTQNSYNKRKTGQLTTSKYKGVKKVGSKWRAYINYRGKQIHLGYHPTAEQAALAYDTKALEVFGGYARCNFGANSAISGEWQQLELPWS